MTLRYQTHALSFKKYFLISLPALSSITICICCWKKYIIRHSIHWWFHVNGFIIGRLISKRITACHDINDWLKSKPIHMPTRVQKEKEKERLNFFHVCSMVLPGLWTRVPWIDYWTPPLIFSSSESILIYSAFAQNCRFESHLKTK